jgi:membrane-bound metal-dependent hydrolase YbcI (DUF457 family)
VPITPFHFGPGAAIHAIAPKRVSFLAFCAANVLIDVEPLYFMLTRQYPLHRVFHTYVGATAVAVATVALFLVARLVVLLPNVFGWRSLTPSQLGAGAAIGVYSHVALDSLMHRDIRPFWPFSEANPLLHAVSLSSLHWFCLLAGVAGLCVLGLRRLAGGHNAP